MIVISEPTKAYLVGYEDKLPALKDFLCYRSKSVDFQIAKFKRATWFISKYGREAYEERLSELKEQRIVSLLKSDSNGYYTYSGLAHQVAHKFMDEVKNTIKYPSFKMIPWNVVPEYEPYPYQDEAIKLLLEAKHGCVSIATGLGKSLIILNVAKTIGLKTLVIAPLGNIVEQLYEDFVKYLGKHRVGKFSGNKKEYEKQFVIATGQSLVRLTPDSPAYKALSASQVQCWDESHTVPCATFQKVCFGLGTNSPYRFFFSATQMRGDGSDLALQGIIGPDVYSMSVRDGVNQGYLAKPIFCMIKTTSPAGYQNPHDPIEMTRRHLFYNPKVLEITADIANKSVELLGHSVLILIEEMGQFSGLLPLFRHPVAFAHGGVTKENAGKIPARYHQSDPKKLVDEFNAGKHPILVGTSCVSTGTNFKKCKTLILLQGGKSEVAVRQSVGRSTRLFEDKKSCNIYDFDVSNIEVTHRHALERMAMYNEIYGPVKEITYGKY